MDSFEYRRASGITALTASISDFRYRKHSHEEYAVGVTLRGIQQYNTGGGLQTSFPGGIMLFNPEQVHDGMSQERSGVDYVMVYIGTELFSEVTGSRERVRFSAPVVYDRRLRRHILNVTHAVFSGAEDALCSELLLALAEDFVQTAPSGARRGNDALMKRARDMMYADSDRTLRLDDICRELDVSKYHFIRAFRHSAGISPYQFHLNCKVERARQVIEQSRDTYLAVAECGFVDLSHLNRHFKSRYGVTAFEYLSDIS